ncbi:MAG: DUF433 domain-containing protein [Candidatus Levybacteria bacterium]|nr:DUF433 domain-containing protein [Candidatus Levybacteria bacterium]
MPDIIEKNPRILGGQPVIKGTRVPVARVLALIGMNYTLKQLKEEIPHLKKLTIKDVNNIFDYYKNQINI